MREKRRKLALFFLLSFLLISIPSEFLCCSKSSSKFSSNELAAIKCMQEIFEGQKAYLIESYPRSYADSLEKLARMETADRKILQDTALARGLKSGYTFTIVGSEYNLEVCNAWSATAWPVAYKKTGVYSFYIDISGILRGGDKNGAVGDVSLPKLNLK